MSWTLQRGCKHIAEGYIHSTIQRNEQEVYKILILESNTWFWDTILPGVVFCKGYSGRRWDTFCCSVLDEPKGDKGAKAD